MQACVFLAVFPVCEVILKKGKCAYLFEQTTLTASRGHALLFQSLSCDCHMLPPRERIIYLGMRIFIYY